MKIEVDKGNWREEERQYTPEELLKIAEFNSQYCLEVEREKRERLAALSRMPRGRILD